MDTHSPWPWPYIELRPPTLNRKFTKLFLSLLVLCVFSDFTFAAEHKVHGSSLKLIRSSRPKDDTVSDLTSENNVAFDDDFLRQAEQNINATDHPVMEVLIQEDPLMRYYENLNIGLALELFYYPTERNFYDSKWHDFYARWSIESKERYWKELKKDKTLSPLTFFAMDTLDPRFRSMKCGFEYEQGCVNMPTLTDVRITRKEDRHSARAILYALLIHQRTFADMHIFVGAIDAARERLQGYCDEFAHTFFHKATHHTVKMCAMEIVNIVMGVIMAVLTIVSLGMCVATFVGLAGIVAAAAGETALLEGLGTVASVFFNAGGGMLAAEGAGLVAEGVGLAAEGAGTVAEAGAAVAEGAGAIASVEVVESIAGSGIAGSEALEMGTAEGLMFGAETSSAVSEAGMTGGSGLGQFGASLERVDSVFSTFVGHGGKVAQEVSQSGQVAGGTAGQTLGTAGRLSGTEIGAEVLDAINAANAAGDSVGNAGSLSFGDAVRAQAIAGLRHSYGEAPAWLTESGSRVGLHVPNQASVPLRWHSTVTNPSVGARIHLRQLLTQATSAFALSSLVPSRLSTIVEGEELESPDITRSESDWFGNDFTASEESVLAWQDHLLEYSMRPLRDDFRTVSEMFDYPWTDTARIHLPEQEPAAPPLEQPEIEVPTQRRPFNPDEYPPNPDGHPTTLRDRVREFLSSVRSRYHHRHDGRWLDRYEAQWDETLRTLEPSTAEELLAEARKEWEDYLRNSALETDIHLAADDNVLWSTLPRLAGGSRSHIRPQPSLPRSPRSSERKKRSEQKYSSSSPRPQVMFSEIESFSYEDLSDDLTSVYDIPSMKDGFITIATERIVAKPPPRQKSATSSRPKSSLKDSNNTASKPNNRTNTSTPKTPPKASKNSALGKAPKHMVSRVTPIFAMIPGADRKSSQILQSNDIWDLGARLSPRFTYPNGTLMNGYVAPYYVEDNAYTIAYYIEQLRRTSNEFPYQDDIEAVLANMQRSKENPEWRILNEVKHQPWADVLGSMQFEGVHAEGAKSDPTLQFKWNPVQHKSSKKSSKSNIESTSGHRKRETIHDFSNGHLLASPRQGKKRSTSKWTMDPDQLTENMFNVRMGNERFTNPIKHEECSTDNYTGDTKENEETCRNILQSKCDEVTDRIKSSLSQLNDPKWVFDNWEPGQPSPVAFYFQDRYPTYTNLLAFQSIGRHTELLKNVLFNNLKNTLVTKAYADGKCYLKCSTNLYPGVNGIGRRKTHQFGDATCLSGCYDPTERRFEAPYGLDPNMRLLDAKEKPWNVSERVMSQVSHKLYENRDPTGYLPGDFRLNPYERSVRDITPILPVCQSKFLKIAVDNKEQEMGQFPCSCGDGYGSESVRFWSASSWLPGYYHYEYDIIKDCRHGPLKSLAANYPAAYIVNFCQIVYIAVAPLGSGSKLEKGNKGSHIENSQFCAKALEFYHDNRNRPDRYLDSNMCKIWSKYAKSKHKEGGHNDFSYVNHDLRKGGCRPWKDYWEDKHTCKKGRKSCDFPDGY